MAAGLPVRQVSLRKRLILIPAVIVTLVMAAALAIQVHQARQRLVTERSSAADLAGHLVREAIANLPAATADPMDALAALVRTLPDLRHVRLFVLPQQEAALAEYRALGSGRRPAPGWFIRLLRPPPWEQWQQIVASRGILGSVVIVADPSDEIAELWDEMSFFAGLLAALTLVFIALVWWSTNKALRPIGQLQGGLDRLERGDFAASLPAFGIAELEPIRRQFNALAESLERTHADNRMLIRTLISLQETERKVLAHELHDELGPCLFGIKAQAACIARMAANAEDSKSTAGAATAILGLVGDLQQLNRRILGRLRPITLDQSGLAAAIGQLVEDWGSRSPDIEWLFRCSALDIPPEEDLAVTIYRVVQESLTNAARHSGASKVVVEMESGPAGQFSAGGLEWPGDRNDIVAHLAIEDDGCGIDPAVRRGFGLLGIGERVHGHGGVVAVGGAGGRGTAVEVLLPLERKSGGGR